MMLTIVKQLESTFFRKITTIERFFSKYFRVGYYGKGFDPSISGKEYIYRGIELERLTDFVTRISTKFPGAQLLSYTEPPSPDITNSPGQYILVDLVRKYFLTY